MPNPKLSVKVGADISPLARAMRRADRTVQGFSGRVDRLGRGISKLGRFAAASAAGVTALSVGVLAIAKNATQAAKDIQNLSNIANTSVETFQRMSFAAQTVGIEQDKLSDILKDVNDKVGDFLATGGGPMADFFENIAPQVGVTAEQFANLSGPQALQLYVDSLEKANVSQERMTFYMEAIANDATGLLPLLRNNGAEFKRLGEEAERAGLVMDQEMIQNGVELDNTLVKITNTMRAGFTKSVMENADELLQLSRWISEDVIPSIVDLTAKVGAAVTVFQQLRDGVDNRTGVGEPSPFVQDQDGAPARISLPTGRNGPPPVETYDPEKVSEFKPSRTGRRGGRSLGPTEADLEQMRRNLATEAELQAKRYEDDLMRLAEFHEAGLLAEEEYQELKQATAESHAQAMNRIESKSAQDRLAIQNDLFGALTQATQAGGQKLQNVGKAVAALQAGINTHVGITEALKLPFPSNMAAAATVAARGFASVAAIQSASVGGVGSGISSAAGAVGAPAESNLTNVSLQLLGDTFSRDSVSDLFKTINEGLEDGYRIRLVT